MKKKKKQPYRSKEETRGIFLETQTSKRSWKKEVTEKTKKGGKS